MGKNFPVKAVIIRNGIFETAEVSIDLEPKLETSHALDSETMAAIEKFMAEIKEKVILAALEKAHSDYVAIYRAALDD